MDYRPLSKKERVALTAALMANTEWGEAILMSPRDTTFAGTRSEVTDDEVIPVIKSVPCHY